VHPGPCSEKVDRLPWAVEQTYELGPYQLGVRTNSARFGAWLEEVLSDHRRAEPIGALYSVFIPDDTGRRQRERHNVLYRESVVLTRTLDLAELVQALRFELESFLFADWKDAALVEAAVVSSDATSALVPTLAALELRRDHRRMERAGLSCPPGGRIAMDPSSGELVAIPSQLAVLDEALPELTGNGQPSQAGSEAGVELPTFDLVCLPTRLGDARSEQVSRAVAVHGLAELVPNLASLGPRALEGLARLVDGVPCYQLTLRPDVMLDALLEVMRSTSPAAAHAE
jgi:hypothetical protein